MVGQSAQNARREPGWIGRDDRTNVLMPATGRRTDGTELELIVHDMSRGGCRLESADATFEIGEWIQLEVPGMAPQPAQVRWALHGSAGVRFEG